MKKKFKREWSYRAFRTFIQTFIGSVAMIVPTIDWNSSSVVLKSIVITLLIPGIPAGVSAVMNLDSKESE